MAYQKLADRLSSLPLVICGPMLRCVTPTSVTVFVALREGRSLTLNVSELAANGTAGQLRLTGTADTIGIGDNLYVAAVTAVGVVQPGTSYVYDVRFDDGTTTVGLLDPGVVAFTASDAGRALTYRTTEPTAPAFPSFTAPPADPGSLRLVHVSCRKPHGHGVDALPTVDLLIAEALRPTATEPRPHLLIHTGDQIYADDVADALLHALIDASDALLGWNPGEVLPIPSGALPPRDVRPGTRLKVIEDGNLTSGYGRSHLLGFGEFCAMYCYAWSPALWPAEMPGESAMYPGADQETLEVHRSHTKGQMQAIESYRGMLPLVRRLLANVPSIMQFDDHEITDDWYRNLNWLMRSQDKSKPAGRFGRTVVRNGLAAFAVFQSWGNTPDRFIPGAGPAPIAGALILELLNQWHGSSGRDDQTSGEPTLELLEKVLGLPEGFQVDRAVRDSNCMRWHFDLRWPNLQVIVLDTRTMRQTLGSANEPPALLFSDGTYQAQLGDIPAPDRDDLVVVVSPAPVFGVLAHEWVSDAKAAKFAMGAAREGLLAARFEPVRTYGVGTEETDPEHWGLQPSAHQRCLAHLATRRAPDSTGVRRSRLVILSGDVHHGSTVRVRYYGSAPFVAGAGRVEAVFAQLTSSAAKNQEFKTDLLAWGSYVDAVFPAHKVHAWLNSSGNTLQVVVDGETRKLKGSPALLELEPTSTQQIAPTPEWSMDVQPQTDRRGVASSGRTSPLVVASLAHTPLSRIGLATASSTLKAALAHRKVVGVNNVGDVRFMWGTGDAKACHHRLWFRLRPDDAAPGPYTEHVVSLEIGEPGGELRYDGMALQTDDHDRDGTGTARYAGTDRTEPAPGSRLVGKLQDDLASLGFTLVGASDGTFGRGTAEAVREMQAAARSACTALAPSQSGGSADDHQQVAVPAGQRYTGPVSGVVDLNTAAAIDRWIVNGWRSPVVVRSMNGANVDQDNVWGFNQVTNPARPVVVRDLTANWSLPAGRDAQAFHVAGRYEANAGDGPIATAPNHVWPQAELLPEAAGPGLTSFSMSAAQRSTFKVIRSVSELECMGYLDCVNAWDDAVISIGPCHWTFGLPSGASKAPGELAGFAAFCEHAYPAEFEATFSRFGLRPSKTWRQLDGSPTGRPLLTDQRKYVGWWSRPHTPTVEMPSDTATANRFRSWHWMHRFQMAARTLPGFRRAMLDMARIRLRDVLATPWGKTTGPDGVPDIGARAATIGDVLTSERAVALLHRWHIFKPAHMVTGNASGPLLRQALTAVGRPVGDPATWPDGFDAQLVTQMLTAVPAGIGDLNSVLGWPSWPANNPRHYALDRDGFASTPAVVPPGFIPPDDISVAGGLLSAHRRSFLLDLAGLPPSPDYSRAGQL